MTGLVAIRQNRAQGFFFPGMQIPDIREGDTLQPGMPVADVLDLSDCEVVARVGELDRANLHEGQEVSIRLDAVPDKHFHGKIKSMSGSASANIFSGDPGKKFDVVFSIDMQQLLTELGAKPEDVRRIMDTAARNARKTPAAPVTAPAGPKNAAPAPGAPPIRQMAQTAPAGARPSATGAAPPAMPAPTPAPDAMDFTKLSAIPAEFGTDDERERAQLPPPPEEDSQLQVLLRPGLLADVEITVERIPDAIHIPAQGVFEKDGQPAVWVQSGHRFQQRIVKLARRSESTMVIGAGLKPGEVIALSDPTAKPSDKKGEKKGAAIPGVPSGGGAGGK